VANDETDAGAGSNQPSSASHAPSPRLLIDQSVADIAPPDGYERVGGAVSLRRRLVASAFIALVVWQITTDSDAYREFGPGANLDIVAHTAAAAYRALGTRAMATGNALGHYFAPQDIAVAVYRLSEPVLRTFFWSPVLVLRGLFDEYRVDANVGLRGVVTGSLALVAALVVAQRSLPRILTPRALFKYARAGVVGTYRILAIVVTDIASIYYVLRLDGVVETLADIAEPALATAIVPLATLLSIWRWAKAPGRRHITLAAGFLSIASFFIYGCFLSSKTAAGGGSLPIFDLNDRQRVAGYTIWAIILLTWMCITETLYNYTYSYSGTAVWLLVTAVIAYFFILEL